MDRAIRTKSGPTGSRRTWSATALSLLAASTLPKDRPKRSTDAAFAQYRLVVLVLAYCGLRWSEVAGLRVGRVDLLRRRLDVAEAVTEVNGTALAWGTPKTHEARSVPLPRFLIDDLAVHMAGRAPADLVFTAPDGGVMRNRNARRAWFNRAASAIGEPGLTPHELRHTAASLAVSSGANVKAVQRILGHASAVMTLDRYADLFDDDLDAVADRLDVARAAAVAPLLPKTQIVDLVPLGPNAVAQ
jgi:integrase